MITLSNYKNMVYGDTSTTGRMRQSQSTMLLERTWNRDIQSKKCYIYDYYHDSEPTLNVGLNPQDDPLKTPIDAKYTVTQYNTLAKDQVEYHLMFRPSQECPLDYFKEYEEKYGVEFPVGLYIDIPDNKGVYRRWMICSRDYDLEFITFSILPCNYYFHWMMNNKKCKMWGIARLRNSYNSGLWAERLTTSVENQDQIWLPSNELSNRVHYLGQDDEKNQRIIISARIPEPLVWKISKLENIHPFGINKITVMQTKFNPAQDYVVPLDKADSVFEMYADYYSSALITDEVTHEPSTDYCSIKYSGEPPRIKIGGGYKVFTACFYNKVGEEISDKISLTNDNWTLTTTNEDGTVSDITSSIDLVDIIKVNEDNYNKIKIRFYSNNNCPIKDCQINHNDYIGKILTLSVHDDENLIHGSLQIELTSV